MIRNLCSSLCDVDANLVGDEALKKKRRTEAPIGSQNLKKQPSAENADKTKVGAEKKTSADDRLKEVAEKKKTGGSKNKTSKKKPAPKDAGPSAPPEEEGPKNE